MVVTEGLGAGRPAHGFIIIVGNAKEILANELEDPDRPDIKRCKYGDFKSYADRRGQDLAIGDCLNERKRNFLNLVSEDGAVVVDRQTGQVCCGGFVVNDLTLGIGGSRLKGASAMATLAGGCYVVVASEAICGSVINPVEGSAKLMVFQRR